MGNQKCICPPKSCLCLSLTAGTCPTPKPLLTGAVLARPLARARQAQGTSNSSPGRSRELGSVWRQGWKLHLAGSLQGLILQPDVVSQPRASAPAALQPRSLGSQRLPASTRSASPLTRTSPSTLRHAALPGQVRSVSPACPQPPAVKCERVQARRGWGELTTAGVFLSTFAFAFALQSLASELCPGCILLGCAKRCRNHNTRCGDVRARLEHLSQDQLL